MRTTHVKRGVDHPHAKLNPDAIRDIRARHKTGELYKVLAYEYGVRISTIAGICHWRLWREVS